jgi:hypothetical protein
MLAYVQQLSMTFGNGNHFRGQVNAYKLNSLSNMIYNILVTETFAGGASE